MNTSELMNVLLTHPLQQALLRESGLLIDRRDGKWIHYRLSPHMPAWAAAVIEQAYLCQRDRILMLSQQADRENATTNGKSVCL